MKKLLFVLLLIPSLCWAGDCQLARMNPYIAGGNYAAAAVDPCGCKTSTYMFCYTGDYSADTDKACFTNGTVAKDGTEVDTGTDITVSADYVSFSAVNNYLWWAVASADGVNDEVGTIYYSVYITDEGDADVEANAHFEIAGTFLGFSNNAIFCSNTTTGTMYCYHEGNNAPQNITSAATITTGQWYRIGYAWSVAEGKHAISAVTCGEDSTCSGISESFATEQTETLTAFEADKQPDSIKIGEYQSGQQVNDIPILIKDMVILDSYKAADPW